VIGDGAATTNPVDEKDVADTQVSLVEADTPIDAAIYGLFNRRMGQLLDFVILVATTDCVAPTPGKRHLADYFRAQVRDARGPSDDRPKP
jgi:hypothetical protein